MSNKKATKRALLTSVMALFLCFAMLLGTTFAWFTDSVSNTGNRIIAGTLKIDLLMYDGSSYKSIAGGTGDLFTTAALAQNEHESLWEPGKTQVVYLAVRNLGTLALKYNIILNISDVAGKASMVQHGYSALEYALYDGATNSTINLADPAYDTWAELKEIPTAQTADVTLGRFVTAVNGVMDELPNDPADGETQYFVLAVHMKEDAGNEFQDAGVCIDINVIATQYEKENDIFDNNTYDHQAHVHSYVLQNDGKWLCQSTLNVAVENEYLEYTDGAYAMVLGPAGKSEPTTAIALTSDNAAALAAIGITIDGNAVNYVRTTPAQTIIIRTNSAETALTINAPNDTVYHYGTAGTMNIIAAANSSVHEYGTVAFVEIAKGRFAMESTADVEQVHISTKILNPATNEKSTDTFDEIIIALAPAVAKPTFSRDEVDVNPTGTLVVALQTGTDAVTEDTELDYVWLTKQGVYEQIKVSDTSESAGSTWVDDVSISEKTQKAAFEIANTIGRNAETKKVEATTNVEEVNYTVTLNEVTRELVIVNTAAPETPVEVAAVTAVTTQVVENAGLTEAEKAEAIDIAAPEAVSAAVASKDDNNIARVGTTGYPTIASAVTAAIAASKTSITLIKDVHVTGNKVVENDTDASPVWAKNKVLKVDYDDVAAYEAANDNVGYELFNNGDLYIYSAKNYTGTEFTVENFIDGISGFGSNTTIRSITFTRNLDYAYKAFQGNTTIRTIDFGGLTKIPNRMFYGFNGMASMTIPEGITTLEEGAFQQSGVVLLDLPGSLTSAAKQSIGYCANLRVLIFRGGNDATLALGDYLCRGCANLETVEIYRTDVTFAGSMTFTNTESGNSTDITAYVANDTVKTRIQAVPNMLNLTVKDIVNVTTAEEVQVALDAGNLAVLQNDISMEATTTAPYGNKLGIEMKSNCGVLDGNGHKFSITNGGDNYAIMTKGGLIQGLTVDGGFRAVVTMYPDQDLILYKNSFGGDSVCYAFNTAEYGEEVNVYAFDSTFSGWTSFAGINSVAFFNCFFGQGTYYTNTIGRLVRPYVNTTFDSCTFIRGHYLDMSALGAGQTITMTNCKANDAIITAENVRNEAAEDVNDDDVTTTPTTFYELPGGRTLADCVIFN